MSIDVMELRKTLGCFATGVAVITATNSDGKPFGLTVNSFTSVSLEPPLVLWCLGKDSDTVEVFESVDRYGVNFLAEGQQELSNHFATRSKHDIGDIGHSIGENGCPILAGVVGSLECEVYQRIDAGDHIIMLGQVLAYQHSSEKPLLYVQGGYNQVATAKS